MKSYVSDDQYRCVGKAWEVRRHLQGLLLHAGPDASLQQFLDTRPFHSAGNRKRLQRRSGSKPG